MTTSLLKVTQVKQHDIIHIPPAELLDFLNKTHEFMDFELVPSLEEGVSAEKATEEKGYPHPGNVIKLPDNGGAIQDETRPLGILKLPGASNITAAGPVTAAPTSSRPPSSPTRCPPSPKPRAPVKPGQSTRAWRLALTPA